jgi:hypothetical protein
LIGLLVCEVKHLVEVIQDGCNTSRQTQIVARFARR